METSIDSLAPDSPILPVMLAAQRAPWVRYHNIVGRIPDKGLIGRVVGGSDGVVSFDQCPPRRRGARRSSSMPTTRASTAIRSAVLEVHRILLEHLAEVDARPPSRLERLPYTASGDQRPGRQCPIAARSLRRATVAPLAATRPPRHALTLRARRQSCHRRPPCLLPLSDLPCRNASGRRCIRRAVRRSTRCAG